MRLFTFLAAAMIVAQPAFARGAQFGRFTTGMTPQQAIEAAPGLAWNEKRHGKTRDLEKVSAANGVAFAGYTWDVAVGEEYGWYEVNFDLRRKFSFSEKAECETAVNSAIAALEPVYGSFGQLPAFAKKSPPYDPFPRGDFFSMAQAGAGSRMRVSGESYQMQDFLSFNGLNIDTGDAVMVKATRYDGKDLRYCEVRINVFGDRRRPDFACKAMAEKPR